MSNESHEQVVTSECYINLLKLAETIMGQVRPLTSTFPDWKVFSYAGVCIEQSNGEIEIRKAGEWSIKQFHEQVYVDGISTQRCRGISALLQSALNELKESHG